MHNYIHIIYYTYVEVCTHMNLVILIDCNVKNECSNFLCQLSQLVLQSAC